MYRLQPASVVLPTTEADLGYAAGIVDGEGHIGAVTRPGGFPRWQVIVNNTSPVLIAHLAAMGGRVRAVKRPKHWKPQERWILTGSRNVEALLSALRPYLLVKAAQADIAVASIRSHPDFEIHPVAAIGEVA